MLKDMSLKIMFSQLLAIILFDLCISTNMLNLPKNFNTSGEYLSNLADRLSEEYAIEYITFIKTGDESLKLSMLNKQLLMQRSNKSWAQGFRNVNTEDQFLACTTCRIVVNAAEKILNDQLGEWIGIDKELYAKRIFLDICKNFSILQQDICAGYFKAYWAFFEYFSHSKQVDKRIFCNRLGIEFCNIKQPMHNWVLTINDDMQRVQKFKIEKPLNGVGVKILQITDIHYDPEYKAGSLAECEEPLCCHQMSVENVTTRKQAGYWGDYRKCDAPLRMIESAFDHMRRTHENVRYIYQTGDIVAHNSWKATRASIMEMFTHMDKLMAEKFPGIPIYPCIGNNDVYPNDFSGPSDVPEPLNNKWLYSRLYMQWSKYLPFDAIETILRGGYYTVSPHVGFRIIALNSNECRLNNLWIYFNASFAIEQLQWLHDTLLMAEEAQEHVHILSHTPIESAECWRSWSVEYFRLIERFQHIISGVFYGHTHTNDMRVHYDNRGNAVSVAWLGSSLTSFYGRNPSYRIYEADAKTMQIIDLETWTSNLTAANLYGSSQNPVWFRLSNFTKDFTTDLSPTGIDALLDRMATDPALLRKYWLSKTTAADPMLARGCDTKCLLATLCGATKQQERCRVLQAKIQQSLQLGSAAQNSAVSSIDLQISLFLLNLCVFCFFYLTVH